MASSVDELIGLSRQYADRGDWPAAISHCEQALAIDTLRIEAHYLLAQIHEHQGAYDAALDAYRRTIYLDRSFVPGLIGMGNIWRQLGRPREARRSYQSALAQLAQLAATTPIPYTAGATAADLQALVSRQLQALD
jgi:chemotaxis protein methyltransferase CheR